MEELRRLLEELLDARLLGIVLSAPRQKESYRRIRIRALDCRGALRFQAAFWDGKKEFHKNYDKRSADSGASGMDEPRLPAAAGGE